MAIWTLAKKELRLLLRDRRAVIILLAMPVIFILILGLSLGEGFGQKPDDRLRVSLVDRDLGDHQARLREGMAWFTVTPGVQAHELGTLMLAGTNRLARPPAEPWSKVVQRDLEQTAGIRIEIIPTREEAERLVRDGKRAAVLVFGPSFSERVTRCSFLADGINPFHRDGVKLSEIDAEMLRDETQLAAASIIEQVAQVTMLRVILPWMIGRAFEKLSEPRFMGMLAEEVPGGKLLPPALKASLGSGVQGALKRLFPKYELTGKTWAALTKSDPRVGGGAGSTPYEEEGGAGLLRRGAVRYQILVPSYTVMFAFFLVLTVGWLFVSERRQGTLKRLRAAPVSRGQILLGKLLPCFALSLVQGLFLLGMGKLVFGMSWGTQPGWLLPVVFTTSLAAMGMALLVASVARTETQVAIYGTLLVLVLAGISGCLMPRELMPEQMKELSRITPHAWALDAYTQLLLNPSPNLQTVGLACLALTAFGAGFVGAAWWFLELD
jgi:ABC-type transport system involved in multi-copper enzyme maturation permease subunit